MKKRIGDAGTKLAGALAGMADGASKRDATKAMDAWQTAFPTQLTFDISDRSSATTIGSSSAWRPGDMEVACITIPSVESTMPLSEGHTNVVTPAIPCRGSAKRQSHNRAIRTQRAIR